MKEFKILTDMELEELDNLQLLAYKKQLWDYGYEMENYVTKLKNQWELVIKILEERVYDIEHDLALLQLDKEDSFGDVDPPDCYLH